MKPHVRYEYTTTASIFCPECHKIMEPCSKREMFPTLVCRDCMLTMKPSIDQLRKVRVVFTMGAAEIKAISAEGKGSNTVKGADNA